MVAVAVRHDVLGSREALARENLIVFTRRLFPGYRPADHHWRIADALQALARGDVPFLAITMPPRHGKSELASVHFPAWFLGRNPDRRIIAASYSAALAYRFSRRARNLFALPDWPFAARTAGDLANVQAWDIAGHRGGYVSAGVGGAITGMGADILLIDDPVKSAEEADSEAFRERAWEWFTQTALTRLEPGGRVVLIGTRWHESDLIGRALEMPQTPWLHLDLPALNDDETEALWPERFPVETLLAIRERIGLRAFAALYQQRPAPQEGALLKRDWWQHWRAPLPPLQWLLQSWDTAYKTGRENDYSVCLTIGLAPPNIYLLDLWRDRVPFPDLKRAVRDQAGKWQPDEIVVEDAASGQSLVQEFGRVPDPTEVFLPPPLPLIGVKPDRDKLARVHAITPYIQAGHVFVPAEAGWADAFVEECAVFPGGRHDDQVDALTQGVLHLAARMGVLRQVDPTVAAAFVDQPSWGG